MDIDGGNRAARLLFARARLEFERAADKWLLSAAQVLDSRCSLPASVCTNDERANLSGGGQLTPHASTPARRLNGSITLYITAMMPLRND